MNDKELEQQRVIENGEGLASNIGFCGFQCKFVKHKDTPLGEAYFFSLDDFTKFNEKKICEAIDKIGNRAKVDFRFSKTKEQDSDFCVIAPYNEYTLSLVQCMSEDNFRHVVVGKDSDNKNVIIDFEKIPHILIAGTTGSGKSVLLHNLICNVATMRDNENRFKRKGMMIIDTKNSDLSRYKAIPNINYVVDVQEAIRQLKVVEQEMDTRYRENKNDFDIFVFIDELADLMLTSKFEVERSIVRIAQLGRACGIHLIIATQRPTIDVVSGLIKANMPYRFALKCASVRDSVVILDRKGAEALEVGQAIFKNGLKETTLKIGYPSDELISKVIQVNGGAN